MRMPSLNGLRAFEATARYLSMRDAAVELCVTASAVSQLVRSLEQELGTALFERRHRALELTVAGERLLPPVRTAFRLIGDAAARVEGRKPAHGLTVSVPGFFAETWLVPRLPSFYDRHAEIDLRIVTGAGLAALASGDVDVAVRHGVGDYRGMVSDLLMAPAVVPVASVSMVERLGLPTKPDALLDWPLIHDADRGAWSLWAAHLGLRRAAPLSGPSFDDPALLRSAILAGQGAGLLPEPLIDPMIQDGSLLTVGPSAAMPTFAYYLVIPRSAVRRPEVTAFRNWIKDAFN